MSTGLTIWLVVHMIPGMEVEVAIVVVHERKHANAITPYITLYPLLLPLGSGRKVIQ